MSKPRILLEWPGYRLVGYEQKVSNDFHCTLEQSHRDGMGTISWDGISMHVMPPDGICLGPPPPTDHGYAWQALARKLWEAKP